MVPGTASATVGVARRSMTPVGVCQRRSMMRGSLTPGGSRSAFLSRISMRGPMPVRLLAAANRGVSWWGRMGCGIGGQTPRFSALWIDLQSAGARGLTPWTHVAAFLRAPAGLYQALEPGRRWRRRPAPSSAGAGLSKPNLMTDDAETRRRRAVYRACHRGTKEMDWILGRFAERSLAACPLTVARPVRAHAVLPDPTFRT